MLKLKLLFWFPNPMTDTDCFMLLLMCTLTSSVEAHEVLPVARGELGYLSHSELRRTDLSHHCHCNMTQLCKYKYLN